MPFRAKPFLAFAWYRPCNDCTDIFRRLKESIQVLDREKKEIILSGETDCDILPNYADGDSWNRGLQAHSMRILEFYDRFDFQ